VVVSTLQRERVFAEPGHTPKAVLDATTTDYVEPITDLGR